MDQASIENSYNVVVYRKSDLPLMRLVAKFLSIFPKIDGRTRGEIFMTEYATTYRKPWDKLPIFAVPDEWDLSDKRREGLWEHERVHADDMRTLWQLTKMFCLLLFFPMPIIFSGRWYIERYAKLVNMRRGELTPEKAADDLWGFYLWAWPRKMAIKWWKEQLEKEGNF